MSDDTRSTSKQECLVVMHNFVLCRGSGDRMAYIWFRWLPSNHNMCNASYSLKKGKDDVSIRSLRVKRLSCPWLDLGCHGRALDCSEHERLKTCRDFVATIAFANYKLVILSLSTWCLGVDGLTQRNPVRCFLNSQALHSWRQQWLTSDLLKRLLCRVLATTIQDERKESTNGVATRPAAWEGELLAVTKSHDLATEALHQSDFHVMGSGALWLEFHM